MVSKSVLWTLYRVERCPIDSLSVLFEVQMELRVKAPDEATLASEAEQREQNLREVTESARAHSYY